MPRDVPKDVAQAWITDLEGLGAALYGALNPTGLNIWTPTPEIQQMTFLVRLNYNEKILDKAKRIENWGYDSGPGLNDAEFDLHGKSGSQLAVARLVKIDRKFEGADEVATHLATLNLRPGLGVELADTALCGHLTRAKIGLSVVHALGDVNKHPHIRHGYEMSPVHGHFVFYCERDDVNLSGHSKVSRRLDSRCDSRLGPNEVWYLAFKK